MQNQTNEWRVEFLKLFFISRLTGDKTHVGAQNDAIEFISKVESDAYERGRKDGEESQRMSNEINNSKMH